MHRMLRSLKSAAFATITFLLLMPASVYGQSDTYEVFAIKFAGTDKQFYEADWASGGGKDVPVPISFMFWLLKGKNGRNILVDAGFMPEKVKEEEFFKIAGYIRPDSALLKLGVKPGDVSDIILSHPHWDHLGGVTLFPNATLWMQKADFDGFVGTAWQKDGRKGGFAQSDVRTVIDLNLAGKLSLIAGDNKEILPGVTVFTGSKHTYDSQYVMVSNGKEKVVIASDNIWIYYSLDHLTPPSPGGTTDPQGYVDAMKRMKSLVSDPKYILPGHDSRVFEKFPQATPGVAAIR